MKFSEPGDVEPMSHLSECVTALTEHLARDVDAAAMVGLSITNVENVLDKVVAQLWTLRPAEG
jgi:hypothetical protein